MKKEKLSRKDKGGESRGCCVCGDLWTVTVTRIQLSEPGYLPQRVCVCVCQRLGVCDEIRGDGRAVLLFYNSTHTHKPHQSTDI